ncbi:MAG: type 4a pilus biogenesis protein PilO [Pseudomonas sp.]|nr:type 4a pilus biogenesis protein PilO [Pseudomonas sp.]
MQQQADQETTLKEQFSTRRARRRTWRPTRADERDGNLFGAMLRQLPSDTEVPGLLEDITRTGLGSGLGVRGDQAVARSDPAVLRRAADTDHVTGTYHDLATFVSGVASLPRIVTLHDLRIKPVDPKASNSQLRMSILAKTYRYNDQGLPGT